MYDLEEVNSIVEPYQRELLSLYYTYVYPSLPILEDRGHLEASISEGSVPASLIAAIYCSAIRFWHLSPALKEVEHISAEPLYDFVFTSMTLEARTPSLRTIQAMLLHMQIPPSRVREPNHPGFWALTCQVSNTWILVVEPKSISPPHNMGNPADRLQLVALAQDTGLHVEPAAWNISSSERKTRRILWWAVYMQDKW